MSHIFHLINTKKELESKMLGSLLGGIVGDAYGAPYEFQRRDTYKVTDNLEFVTTFKLPAGSFTDDGSMMLCLAESLVKCNGHNGHDQMERYLRWYKEGYMSSAPERGCFDVGNATARAINLYAYNKEHLKKGETPRTTNEHESMSSGNGGIMRLAPIPVFYFKCPSRAIEYAKLSSATTHKSKECLDSAALMTYVISKCLHGAQKQQALDNTDFENSVMSDSVKDLCRGFYKTKPREGISTSGYVIHSLEAALWALHKYDTFIDGMKELASMGEDTDTVCCIYGQMAGALYGLDAVPKQWIKKLQRKDMVMNTVKSLVDVAMKNKFDKMD
jgi:ADP-ribosyl-[dinitrogen reductase] hydrolase